MNVDSIPWPLRDLKDNVKIVRSMVIKHMNANLMPSGHQTSIERYKKWKNPIIGITTQSTVVTTVKNMDMFLRISLEKEKN